LNYEFCENKSIIEYSDSIFETILVEEGHPYFLDEHLIRLEKAGRDILNTGILIDEVKSFVYKCIPKVGRFALRIVFNINSCVLSLRDVEYKGSGFLKISSIIRDSMDIKYRYKTSDYCERLEELANVRKSGFLDALYLNEKSVVTSCSIANIFFIKNNRIYTPAIETGALNGIVRSLILDNSDCNQGEYTISDFLDSDGIFITNSVIGILRIEGIGDKIVKCNEKVLNQISEMYRLSMDFDRRKCCG
jgi:4-amino-4-deoxychorismate lyase